MSALASLSINDGQATPVAHTFNPVSTDGSRAQWAERSAGVPSGYFTLSHEVRNPASATAAYRVLIGLNVPVMATVNGVLTVVRNSSAQVTLNCSAQSTVQERKDLLAYVANFLGNATVKTSVQDLEPFY
jgi:hypothetical protein